MSTLLIGNCKSISNFPTLNTCDIPGKERWKVDLSTYFRVSATAVHAWLLLYDRMPVDALPTGACLLANYRKGENKRRNSKSTSHRENYRQRSLLDPTTNDAIIHCFDDFHTCWRTIALVRGVAVGAFLESSLSRCRFCLSRPHPQHDGDRSIILRFLLLVSASPLRPISAPTRRQSRQHGTHPGRKSPRAAPNSFAGGRRVRRRTRGPAPTLPAREPGSAQRREPHRRLLALRAAGPRPAQAADVRRV